MSEILEALPLRQRYDISNAIRAGDKLKAVRLYRDATGCELQAAYNAVEALAAQMQAANPYAFKQQSERRSTAIGCSLLITILILVSAALLSIDYSDFIRQLQRAFENKPLKTEQPQNPPAPPKVAAPAQPQAPALIKPKAQAKSENSDTPYRVVIPEGNELDIAKLYRKKLANPDYLRWLDLPGLPQGYQDYPEEHAIKYARAQIARQLRAPAYASIAAIPLRQNVKVAVDGVIDAQEWQNARRIELSPETTGSILYLQADGEWLYLACDVPGETTPGGFDQLRLYFHVDIDPAIKNERIHLDRYETRLGGIRETTVIRDLRGGRSSQPISDWQIFRMARGATALRQHRQYEAKIHLAESGLHYGIPFPVFVEVETDPLMANGKFKQRQYLGTLGSQQRPVWWMIL